MTISELICRLQSVKCELGDLPVTCEGEELSNGHLNLRIENGAVSKLVIEPDC